MTKKRHKENLFTFQKKICIIPKFKEENLYFAKFKG